MPPTLRIPAAGETLADKYTVLWPLGEGGMGVVVEAMHVRLDQAVALKFLRPELAGNPRHVLRFEREARAAARLKSQHVVRIFDVENTPEGLPYIVMERLHGHDLAHALTQSSVPSPHFIDWILEACIAMAEAHAVGVIHRDLKPTNVFLAVQHGGVVVKVLDFGISKIMDSASVTTSALSLGTPQFMSPEQVRSAKNVDGRADIWALGVTLYRALAGRFPFAAESPSAIAVAIATEPATSLDIFRPDLPEGLCTAVMRAMAKKPEDRFQRVEDLALAIQPYGSGRVTTPFR